MASRSQIQALAARVEVLEARSRRRARVALLALIVAPVAAWLAARPSAELRVERLLVEDGDGRVFAELGLDEGRPSFVLRDAAGRTRIRQLVGPAGPGVGVFGAEPGWQGWLGASDDLVSLGLYDGDGTRRAELLVKPEGTTLQFKDDDGVLTHVLGPGLDG